LKDFIGRLEKAGDQPRMREQWLQPKNRDSLYLERA
jgi:hypothetical protein